MRKILEKLWLVCREPPITTHLNFQGTIGRASCVTPAMRDFTNLGLNPAKNCKRQRTGLPAPPTTKVRKGAAVLSSNNVSVQRKELILIVRTETTGKKEPQWRYVDKQAS